MTDQAPQETTLQLTKEDINNIKVVLTNFKGFTIAEAQLMSNIVNKLDSMYEVAPLK